MKSKDDQIAVTKTNENSVWLSGVPRDTVFFSVRKSDHFYVVFMMSFFLAHAKMQMNLQFVTFRRLFAYESVE